MQQAKRQCQRRRWVETGGQRSPFEETARCQGDVRRSGSSATKQQQSLLEHHVHHTRIASALLNPRVEEPVQIEECNCTLANNQVEDREVIEYDCESRSRRIVNIREPSAGDPKKPSAQGATNARVSCRNATSISAVIAAARYLESDEVRWTKTAVTIASTVKTGCSSCRPVRARSSSAGKQTPT